MDKIADSYNKDIGLFVIIEYLGSDNIKRKIMGKLIEITSSNKLHIINIKTNQHTEIDPSEIKFFTSEPIKNDR